MGVTTPPTTKITTSTLLSTRVFDLPGHGSVAIHGGAICDRQEAFTHYSGFCGVGSFARAWRLLGGTCVGGFDADPAGDRLAGAHSGCYR